MQCQCKRSASVGGLGIVVKGGEVIQSVGPSQIFDTGNASIANQLTVFHLDLYAMRFNVNGHRR